MVNITLIALFFVSLYPFGLTYFPPLTTRIVIGVIGAIILALNSAKMLRDRSIIVKRNLLYIYFILTAMAIISIITASFNNTNELVFVTFFQSATVGFLNAIFIFKILQHFNRAKEFDLIKYIIYAITFQSFFSLLLFLYPNLSNLVNSIVYNTELREVVMDKVSGKRIVGFSRSFFGAGIFSGMGLLLIAYSIKYHNLNKKDIFIMSILFLFIFLIGMMMARTTIVGATLGLLLLVLPKNINFRLISIRKLKFLMYIIFIPVTFVFVLMIITPNLIKEYQTLLDFAFELFINYSETGEIRTSSTDGVFNMFHLPTNPTTWIIGDGRWHDPYGLGYYMNVDIGYLRLLYYFGIGGLLSYIIYHYLLIKGSFTRTLPSLLFFTYFLILNIKGHTDLTPIFTLLLIMNYNRIALKAD